MSDFSDEYKQSWTGVIAKTITTCNQLTPFDDSVSATLKKDH